MGCATCGTTATTENGKPAGCKGNGNCHTGGCNKFNTFDWLSDIPLSVDQRFDICEISFKNGNHKGFYRNTSKLDLTRGDMVVVNAPNGYDIGEVSLSGELVRLQMKKKGVKPDSKDVGTILRIATDNDLKVLEEARSMEKETMLKARVIARNLNLDMKVGDVEYQGDKRKATFYYIADGRVDFRELIKLYAREFRVKVEMRQIGARQEAGLIGGVGSCGRELCCSTWLADFKSVTTSAARYQNLSINQTKLSGQCGRLKCCLNYELDTYMDALQQFPKKADRLETKRGEACLQKTDIFKGLMWYTYSDDQNYIPLTVEMVKVVQELNRKGKRPDALMAVAIEEPEEDMVEEYADVVGHVNLNILEKGTKKKKKKRRNRNRNQNRRRGGGGDKSKNN